ncbi:hypothetical protein [Fusobacterium mortiferum]|nr:hypothetical protein [Fusobacterium mortiferum]
MRITKVKNTNLFKIHIKGLATFFVNDWNSALQIAWKLGEKNA